jgi:hydroxypyruvate isomerase
LRHESIVGHVQLADFPGRSEPGTGEIDVAAFIEAVAGSGYDGWIGLEFLSKGPVSALAWTHAIPVPRHRHGVPTEIGTPTGP